MTLNQELIKEKERLLARINLIDGLLNPILDNELTVDIEELKSIVIITTGFDECKILSKSRKPDIVFSRQLLSCLIYKFNTTNYSEIAKVLDMKTHSNVIHSLSVIENIIKTSRPQRYKNIIEKSLSLITNQTN